MAEFMGCRAQDPRPVLTRWGIVGERARVDLDRVGVAPIPSWGVQPIPTLRVVASSHRCSCTRTDADRGSCCRVVPSRACCVEPALPVCVHSRVLGRIRAPAHSTAVAGIRNSRGRQGGGNQKPKCQCDGCNQWNDCPLLILRRQSAPIRRSSSTVSHTPSPTLVFPWRSVHRWSEL